MIDPVVVKKTAGIAWGYWHTIYKTTRIKSKFLDVAKAAIASLSNCDREHVDITSVVNHMEETRNRNAARNRNLQRQELLQFPKNPKPKHLEQLSLLPLS